MASESTKESNMSIALMVALGIALIAAGAGMTFILTTALPQAVLQRAQEHGRYAGLAVTDDRDENTGKRMAAGGSNPRRHTARVA
jgi:hypothetical protein